MRDSEKSAKKHVELVNPNSFIVLNSRVKYLEFFFTSLFLTPHQIGIGQKITLISSTLHALKVFMTPITTFEETLDRQKTATLTSFQILNQVELVEERGVKPIEGAINQLVIEDRVNLRL